MAYNSSVQASTGFTPFYLMFGQQAKLPVDIIYGTSRMEPEPNTTVICEYAKLLRKRMTEAFELVKVHTSNQHQRQKELYDKKIHGKPHKKGDLVWLHTQPTSRISS